MKSWRARRGPLGARATRLGCEPLELRNLLTVGIWITPDEIAALPTSGPAWSELLSAANSATASPDLSDQDENTDVYTLAKALVGVRLDSAALKAEVRANVMAAIGTEAGGRTLALGRNLLSYVVAADLVGLSAADDAAFRAWLSQVLDEDLEGLTLRSTHEIRSNNWGTMAGASRAAAARYLGDSAELARVAQVFRGWLGDSASYAGFSFDEDDPSWHADPENLLPVNPHGAILDGHSVDGALPEEMRRGATFQWPAAQTNYPWGALQGAVAQAEVLFRAGYDDVWLWQDRALLRTQRFLASIGWQAEGDDQWIQWIVDSRYGTDLVIDADGGPGKNMGWTAWTHALPTVYPANLAPIVDAGVDQFLRPGMLAELAGQVLDDGLPTGGALSTAWSLAAGPAGVQFADAAALVTTASFAAPGNYVLRLTVGDGALADFDDLTIVVDGTAPTVDVLNVSPDPRDTAVSQLRLAFSEPVFGLDPAGLTLTRGGGPNLLTGDETIETDDYLTWRVKNLSGLTLTAGTYTFSISAASQVVDAAGNPLLVGASDSWTTFAKVVDRRVFYNNSAWDGPNPAANANDDLAIATDKAALLPGGTAGVANYTSYSRGINGVMVDVAGVPGTVAPADFSFRVGNNNATANWTAPSISPTVTLRPGAGLGGSLRVSLIWPDGAIKKQWLQVTLRPSTGNGLQVPDVFYFGNAIGETGNSTTSAVVNAADEIAARLNPRNPLNPAPIDFPYDVDRDRLVNAADQIQIRIHSTNPLTALVLLGPPASATSGSAASLAASAIGSIGSGGSEQTDWSAAARRTRRRR